MEDVTNAEEELIKECEEMWKDVEECQKKLSLVGTETLTDSNAQLSLLIMQVKCLTAELNQWQKESPGIIPLNEEVLVTLGKEEFQKLRHDLELVLSTIQSKNEKLKEDLEREQQWLDEQQQILQSLNVLHSELKHQVVTFSESRIFDELKTKMHDIKEYKEKLLITLGEFLEDHFPLPDGNVKKKKKNIQESTAQLLTPHEMLEGSSHHFSEDIYQEHPLIKERSYCPAQATVRGRSPEQNGLENWLSSLSGLQGGDTHFKGIQDDPMESRKLRKDELHQHFPGITICLYVSGRVHRRDVRCPQRGSNPLFCALPAALSSGSVLDSTTESTGRQLQCWRRQD
ncbi:hypothetical protein GH733_004582 [Mirounga leonina]|nr:hypothetical protein GH733_004582 [Mirounga leonina]